MNRTLSILIILPILLVLSPFFLKDKAEPPRVSKASLGVAPPPVASPFSSDNIQDNRAVDLTKPFASASNVFQKPEENYDPIDQEDALPQYPEDHDIQARGSPYVFSDPRLTEDEVSPFLGGRYRPARITFSDEDGSQEITPKTTTQAWYYGNVLRVGSDGLSKKTAQDRADDAYRREPPPYSEKETPEPGKTGMGVQEYKLSYLLPGKRDDGATISLPKSISKGIYGPDVIQENVDPKDTDRIAEIRSRVVSFGHGGEMVLELLGGGSIYDETGPDFVVYENVMRFGQGKLYQEFARVGVSETADADDFIWFPCDPDHGQVKGCAGVVPTDEGGDMFDLAEIGVQKARFIKIRDLGDNFNLGENTEGFDLDALGILHGYRQELPY